jgi:sporulation protein YlmC with PRC-barrel domain
MGQSTSTYDTIIAGDKGGAAILPDSEHHSSGPGPEVMDAATLKGDNVVNSAGDDIGGIKAIMLDVARGRIAYAVLSFGGFLGVGSKLFAIPWSALTLDAPERRFLLDIDKETLENAPGFDKDHWPSMADQSWATRVHDFYKVRPYWDDTYPPAPDLRKTGADVVPPMS